MQTQEADVASLEELAETQSSTGGVVISSPCECGSLLKLLVAHFTPVDSFTG